MSFFSWNSPLMQSIGKATDLFILNVLCFFCCLPVVTAGAAMTARYSVAMKILRQEEPQIFKGYFKAFKDNFKVSTICWLIELAIAVFLVFDWNLLLQFERNNTNVVFIILLGFVSFVVLASIFNTFAFIARFEMKIIEYLKAAVVMTLIKIPRMILALILIAAPVVLGYFYIKWLPAVVAIIPMLELYFNGMMYVKAFKKIEEKMSGNQEKKEKEDQEEAVDEEGDQNDENNDENEKSEELKNEKNITDKVDSEDKNEKENEEYKKDKVDNENKEDKREKEDSEKEIKTEKEDNND